MIEISNNNNVFTRISASNHAKGIRETHDYYATEPKAVELLTEIEDIKPLVLEPCCGEGHISEVLENKGHNVISTDLIYRGYGAGNIDLYEYHNENGKLYRGDLLVTKDSFDIVTNPPYRYANEMTEHMLSLLNDGGKLIQFLKLTFLESKARKELFKKYPLKTLHVSSSRLITCKNGDFDKYKSRAVAYGWFVWEKGYEGEPTIKWFN